MKWLMPAVQFVAEHAHDASRDREIETLSIMEFGGSTYDEFVNITFESLAQSICKDGGEITWERVDSMLTDCFLPTEFEAMAERHAERLRDQREGQLVYWNWA